MQWRALPVVAGAAAAAVRGIPAGAGGHWRFCFGARAHGDVTRLPARSRLSTGLNQAKSCEGGPRAVGRQSVQVGQQVGQLLQWWCDLSVAAQLAVWGKPVPRAGGCARCVGDGGERSKGHRCKPLAPSAANSGRSAALQILAIATAIAGLGQPSRPGPAASRGLFASP